jgi:hypothetical protein
MTSRCQKSRQQSGFSTAHILKQKCCSANDKSQTITRQQLTVKFQILDPPGTGLAFLLSQVAQTPNAQTPNAPSPIAQTFIGTVNASHWGLRSIREGVIAQTPSRIREGVIAQTPSRLLEGDEISFPNLNLPTLRQGSPSPCRFFVAISANRFFFALVKLSPILMSGQSENQIA